MTVQVGLQAYEDTAGIQDPPVNPHFLREGLPMPLDGRSQYQLLVSVPGWVKLSFLPGLWLTLGPTAVRV